MEYQSNHDQTTSTEKNREGFQPEVESLQKSIGSLFSVLCIQPVKLAKGGQQPITLDFHLGNQTYQFS
jgi:hypothetical protein